MSNAVFAFEVSVKGTEWSQTVNARTRGAAKVTYWRQVADAWPTVPYTAMRCRKIGNPHTSAQFVRNAQYRGWSGTKCGDRVMVGKSAGTIVGHNSSANFDVLFDSAAPEHAGLTLNCHPSECVSLEAKS